MLPNGAREEPFNIFTHTSPMAAKKTKTKAASKKTKPKTAKKSAKKVTKIAKKAAKPAKKKAAVKKKAAKKAAPKKKAPAKKKAAKKKAVVKKAAKKKAAAPKKKAAAPKKKAAAPKKKAAPAPKIAVAAKPKFTPKPAAPKPRKGSHSSSFIKKQEQRLLDLRDELVDAMNGMTRDTIRNAPEGSEASGSGQHQGDAGSDAYDRDFALSVLAKEQDALYEIEKALQRVSAGTYGICEMSGNKIPTMRLEVIPFARLTVDCQAQWEKEYGNRRFRPTHEMGFNSENGEDSESVSLDDPN